MNSRKPSHDSLRLFRLFRTGSAPGGSLRFPMRWSTSVVSFFFCSGRRRRLPLRPLRGGATFDSPHVLHAVLISIQATDSPRRIRGSPRRSRARLRQSFCPGKEKARKDLFGPLRTF